MSRLVESTLISLDGVVRDPQVWAMSYFDEEAGKDALTLLQEHDAMVFGRRTFEALRGAWSSATGPFADRLAGIPKYVFSSTLTAPEWDNTTIVTEDVVSAVRALKDEHERGLVVYGHGRLTQTLHAGGLVDELRLNLHPVVVGGERDPLQTQTSAFVPVSSRTRGSGVVVLTYRAAS